MDKTYIVRIYVNNRTGNDVYLVRKVLLSCSPEDINLLVEGLRVLLGGIRTEVDILRKVG